MRKYNWKDILVRGGWTLAQAALGFITTLVADIPVAYAPMIAAVLSFAKSYVAQRLEARNA